MRYLLTIALGPVQDFIAAARRTSDLTAGSQFLVEVAKAAARAIKAEGGMLIFPASAESDGPNKILAALPEGAAPKMAAEAARAAAVGKLREEWRAAKSRLQERYGLNAALADAQIERFLEFYAAWIPFTEETYATARAQVDALLAGRKNLRDFGPPPEGIAPVRGKSPLDPAFECVVTMPNRGGDEPDTGFLRLRQTEFLDAVSLLKRVKGGRESGKVPSTRAFARRQTEPGFFQDDSQDDDAQEAYPYFAILHADGDQMGKLLNGMKTPDAHREFSQTLAKFATDAKEIVARHDGYAVYTGGDDVLAFLPVRTAVECARELAKTFQEAVGATLSAGVAVCHYRQPLSLSREAVQRAEKRAKNEGNRNALCLALHTRGGQPLFVTRKWADWARFETWTGAFRNGSLTRGVAYELRELAKEFQEVENVPSDLLELEAKRIWSRKQSESKEKRPDFPAGMASNVEALKAFADMLVAARFLTEKETR